MPGDDSKSDIKSSNLVISPLGTNITLNKKITIVNNIVLQNSYFARTVLKPDNNSYIQIYDATGKIHQEKAMGLNNYVTIFAMLDNQICYTSRLCEGILKVTENTLNTTAASEQPTTSTVTLTSIIDRQLQPGDDMTSIVAIQYYDETHMLIQFYDYRKLMLLTPNDLKVAFENKLRINALFMLLTPAQQGQIQAAGFDSEIAKDILTATLNETEKSYFTEILNQYLPLYAIYNRNAQRYTELFLSLIPSNHQIIELDASALDGCPDTIDFTIPDEKCVAVVNDKQLGFWRMDNNQFTLEGIIDLAACPTSMCSLGWDQRFALAYPIPSAEDETIKLETYNFTCREIVATSNVKDVGTRFLSMQTLTQPPGVVVAVAPFLQTSDPKTTANSVGENDSQQHIVIIDPPTGSILQTETRYYTELSGIQNYGKLVITPDSKVALPVLNVRGDSQEKLALAHDVILFEPECSKLFSLQVVAFLSARMLPELTSLIMEYCRYNIPPSSKTLKRSNEKSSPTASAGDHKNYAPVLACVTSASVTEIALPGAGIASVAVNHDRTAAQPATAPRLT